MQKEYTIDLRELENLEKEEIYDLLEAKLHLPNYCGTNLDALYDALSQMEECVINIIDCRKKEDCLSSDNKSFDDEKTNIEKDKESSREMTKERSSLHNGSSYIDRIRKVFEDVVEINPSINLHIVDGIYLSKYISLYDYEYEKGKHYLNASRRSPDRLVYTKSISEFKKMTADAVSCIVIVDNELYDEPRLLLSREYRYPTGQFLLSVPAGLIDLQDIEAAEFKTKDSYDDNNNEKSVNCFLSDIKSPAMKAAVREIKEETGITLTDKDIIKTVNPLVFSTPGMTDESNALVSVIIKSDIRGKLSQDGAEGAELFDGFELMIKSKAKEILKKGTDDNGIFYSVYTFIALMYFVSDMWTE